MNLHFDRTFTWCCIILFDLKTKTSNFLKTFHSGHWLLVKWWMQSYFRIWSSLPWSLLWAGFTLQTIFRLSSLFFFTMSRNNVCSFSYSSSHVVNTSKQATMICALKITEIQVLRIIWLLALKVLRVTKIHFLLTISIHCQEIRLWRIIKWSPKRKCLDHLSNSLNTFFRKCLEISLENLYVDIGA